MTRFPTVTASLTVLGLLAGTFMAATPTAFAQAPVATYLFNDTLAAQEGGVPALTLLDPVAGSTTGFQTTNVTYNSVNNGNRRVLHLDGNASAGQNAGLQLNIAGVLASNSSYTFESVFLMPDRNNAYRKVLDVLNRASDTGFYVNPSNVLGIFSDQNPSSGPTFTPNTFFHVAMTQSGGTVSGYLNGALAFSGPSTTMVIDSNNLLNFFLDDNATSNGEYSDSTVALIRLYNGALNSAQISTLASSPLPGVGASAAAPEPGSLALLVLTGLPFVGAIVQRRRRDA